MIFKYLLILILLLINVYFSTAAMRATGPLCELITATNLHSLVNYGWACTDSDCSAGTTFALTPVSGVCASSKLVSIYIINANGNAGLNGSIPANFGDTTYPLSSIELQTNKLVGTIPTNLASIHTTLTYRKFY